MANHRIDSEEEALFRSYPYALYFVQSPPSTISHALTTNYTNDDHLTYNSPIRQSEATDRHLALSHYSSSRGSSNSFLLEVKKKHVVHGVLEDDHHEKGGGVVKNNDDDDDQDHDHDDFDYDDDDDDERNNRSGGWIKYFSFSYSNSGWWIWMQLSWRFLLSLMIALAVFYVVAKPPPPKVFVKIARIGQFKLSEGVDGSGVTTKLLSCNCSIDLTIDNKSKLFGLHINPPIIEILFGRLPFAMSQGGELYAGSDDTTSFGLSVGTRNKAMYGAGRNMQDLVESGKGLPLVVRVRFRSSFHVVLGLLHSKSHHQAQCLVILADKYDKKLKTQVYNSTCIINS